MPKLVLGDSRSAVQGIARTLGDLLATAKAHDLEHPISVLRWAKQEIDTFVEAAEAERKSRIIGDPECPAGYR